MHKLIFTIFFTLVLYGAKCKQNCDTLGTLVYEDIGCKAVMKEGQECPIKYECDDFSIKNNSCLFRGKRLAVGERIDNNITNAFCTAGCFCSENNPGGFICAAFDCPEFFGLTNAPGCYRTYALDKCCSVGKKCYTTADYQLIEKCKANGMRYNEGEKFYPKNTCKKCICPKNFNGKYEAPHCQRFSCGVQIRHSQDLENNCAPFYEYVKSERVLCCPTSWICPSPTDAIKNLTEVSDTELTCKFGNKILKYGEGFERNEEVYGTERHIKCECILPPLLTCTEIVEEE